MCLTTLANVIATVAPDAGSTEQAVLKHFLRRANALIRTKTRRFHGGVIEANTAAAATVITSYGHGLESGDSIVVSGSDCTPTIDGERVVTRIDQDKFSVPVTVTAAGDAGYYARQLTEFYDGTGRPEFTLSQVPVLSIENLWVDSNGNYGQTDGGFADETLLELGVDYVLQKREPSISLTGVVCKLSGAWPGLTGQSGQTQFPLPGRGNIKVEYVHGYRSMPADLSLAAEIVVGDLYRTAARGAAMASESLDYYSYTRMTTADEEKALASAKSLIAKFTTALV